ncbi:MAG TPA: DUF445 domain-containing protein [Acidimicrobiales bacterium]|nr:DUF445 domain-containing protein [Acidimicrobiales bacterium]
MKTSTTAERDVERGRQLRRMKWRATGMLIVAAAVYVVTRISESEYSWLGYVRATAEAAMVGGLADWFAVTALFRHPLGLRIPHTAVIKTRKAQLGRSLGEFVQENFLAREVVTEKLRQARVGERLGVWLRDTKHAQTVSQHTSAALAGALDVLHDDDVQSALEHSITARLRQIEASPTAARVLAIATADGRHRELVDAMAKGAARFLEERRGDLRSRFSSESPWWVPEPIDDRIFDKIYRGLATFLQQVIDDPSHELRQHLDARLADLVSRLSTDPALIARGEKLKEEILEHPAVRNWMGSLWGDLKRALLVQSNDPDSELRRRIEQTALAFGTALSNDASLRAKVDRWVEGAASYIIESYRHEVADLIETTVAKWDADEASQRIELQVGRDLQFIRINGTLVGGLAGLAIYSVGQLIG